MGVLWKGWDIARVVWLQMMENIWQLGVVFDDDFDGNQLVLVVDVRANYKDDLSLHDVLVRLESHFLKILWMKLNFLLI